MKKYRRIEVVEAKPMIEYEAISKGYSLGRLGYDSEWEEGYHVEELTLYGETYDHWVPKDVFEKAFKPSDTILDRLKIEQHELRERIEKLEDFIGLNFAEAAKKVGHYQAALLLIQRSYMVNYLDVLETRIDLMEKETGN